MPLPKVQANAASTLRHLTVIWKPGFRSSRYFGNYTVNGKIGGKVVLVVDRIAKFLANSIKLLCRQIHLSECTNSSFISTPAYNCRPEVPLN